ncbi:MAG: hypothetical protein ABW043_17495, partial [Devosia sp.]|uniref:hypothetical protein n=1 Tax=Devosia sp. TaxID=1871048 RepID=UPI003395BC4D
MLKSSIQECEMVEICTIRTFIIFRFVVIVAPECYAPCAWPKTPRTATKTSEGMLHGNCGYR